ncbi:hypothetical protein HOP50_19g84040 [Chloropicon primus]|uniref:Uncharacterized protein n=1 Tax=Chloropicon primus TaxID=1764295 RepID=A0A5B8N192_9CHLO|nr:hypothetical protein A3770_19p83800 [Chloropicon primus]UPR05057.1 hypothetical protein HOP50_19g84040 [Chloropicon primus]|eukprot:QDZ25862.1 hypothetical protein A3770_19p83800 [Chloropicon primus]
MSKVMALSLPSLDNKVFKTSTSFKGLGLYDLTKKKNKIGKEEIFSEVVVLTEAEVCFISDKRLGTSGPPSLPIGKTRMRLMSNKSMGTSKSLASLGLTRLPEVTGKEQQVKLGANHAIVGCSDSSVKVIDCETLDVTFYLDFAKGSVPNMLCDAAFVPATSVLSTMASGKDMSFALFAAASDGNICSWLLTSEQLQAKRTQPLGVRPSSAFHVGKCGLFSCHVKRSPWQGAPHRGAEADDGNVESFDSTLYAPWHVYAFTQDGNLNIIRCVDERGRLVLGKGAQQAQTIIASLKFSTVNFAKEKKISFRCEFVTDDVFGFTITSKQRSGQQQLQFSRISIDGQKAELESLPPFELEKHLRKESAAAAAAAGGDGCPSRRTKGGKVEELKIHCLCRNGSFGGLAIGTSLGLTTLATRFEMKPRPLLISQNATDLIALKTNHGDRLALEHITCQAPPPQGGGRRGKIHSGMRRIQSVFPNPVRDLDRNAKMEFSARRKFLSVLSSRDELFLYEVCGNGLLQIDHSLGKVKDLAWNQKEERNLCVCCSTEFGPGIRFLSINTDSKQIEVIGDGEANGEILSLGSGPCLAVVTRRDGKENLEFVSWEQRRPWASGTNLNGVDLPGYSFMEWSQPQSGSSTAIQFCAIGYSNTLLILASQAGTMSYIGSLGVKGALGCLWEGECLFVNTQDAIFAAFLSSAAIPKPLQSDTMPRKMQSTLGLIAYKSLTGDLPDFSASISALCNGKFSMLSYSPGGTIWCTSEHDQVFAVDVIGLRDQLKIELEGSHFSSYLSAVESKLTSEDKNEIFNFVCQRGLLARVPQILSYAGRKEEQIWGLYSYEKMKALQLCLHYIKGMATEYDGNTLRERSLTSFEALLLTSKEILRLTESSHPDGRTKVAECLSHVCSLGKHACTRSILHLYGGSGLVDLPRHDKSSRGIDLLFEKARMSCE